VNDKLKYSLIGALAGIANGLFGSGGGLFLVPLFIGWLHMEQKKAFATSIAVILPLSAASFLVFLLRGEMDWGLALPYLLGGVAGGLLSGLFFKKISAVWLRRGFGLLILYGGIRAVLLL
jgi:hypothetical protein